jgi:hypothetical protein
MPRKLYKEEHVLLSPLNILYVCKSKSENLLTESLSNRPTTN